MMWGYHSGWNEMLMVTVMVLVWLSIAALAVWALQAPRRPL